MKIGFTLNGLGEMNEVYVDHTESRAKTRGMGDRRYEAPGAPPRNYWRRRAWAISTTGNTPKFELQRKR
jgi:hypothetical protein